MSEPTNTKLNAQRNMEEANRKAEENVQKLLAGFERKEQQVVKMRESILGTGECGGKMNLPMSPASLAHLNC